MLTDELQQAGIMKKKNSRVIQLYIGKPGASDHLKPT